MHPNSLNLHDSEIMGLEIIATGGSKNLALKVKDEEHRVKIINFNDVVFLDCSGFAWQNVISEAVTFDIAKMQNSEIKKVVQQRGLDLNQINIDLNLVKKGYLVSIQSSIGAEIILICSSFNSH